MKHRKKEPEWEYGTISMDSLRGAIRLALGALKSSAIMISKERREEEIQCNFVDWDANGRLRYLRKSSSGIAGGIRGELKALSSTPTSDDGQQKNVSTKLETRQVRRHHRMATQGQVKQLVQASESDPENLQKRMVEVLGKEAAERERKQIEDKLEKNKRLKVQEPGNLITELQSAVKKLDAQVQRCERYLELVTGLRQSKEKLQQMPKDSCLTQVQDLGKFAGEWFPEKSGDLFLKLQRGERNLIKLMGDDKASAKQLSIKMQLAVLGEETISQSNLDLETYLQFLVLISPYFGIALLSAYFNMNLPKTMPSWPLLTENPKLKRTSISYQHCAYIYFKILKQRGESPEWKDRDISMDSLDVAIRHAVGLSVVKVTKNSGMENRLVLVEYLPYWDSFSSFFCSHFPRSIPINTASILKIMPFFLPLFWSFF